MSDQMTGKMQECIDHCLACSAVCIETIPHCLVMGGAPGDHAQIGMLLDCADLCRTAAEFMSRGSPAHPSTCALCADACDRCADECERMDENDAQMQRCARLCRECAESCREMALAAADQPPLSHHHAPDRTRLRHRTWSRPLRVSEPRSALP